MKNILYICYSGVQCNLFFLEDINSLNEDIEGQKNLKNLTEAIINKKWISISRTISHDRDTIYQTIGEYSIIEAIRDTCEDIEILKNVEHYIKVFTYEE